VQAMPRNARIDVEDVCHVVTTIGPSVVPCIATKERTSAQMSVRLLHVGRALYRPRHPTGLRTPLNMARERLVNVRLGRSDSELPDRANLIRSSLTADLWKHRQAPKAGCRNCVTQLINAKPAKLNAGAQIGLK
jgi:hypothetical protein